MDRTDKPKAAPQYAIELFTLPDGQWFATIRVTWSRSDPLCVSTPPADTCRQALDGAAKWVHQHRIGRAPATPAAAPAENTPPPSFELGGEHC